MESVKIIIFDLDDTLVDTFDNMYIRIKEATQIVLQKEISKNQFSEYYGIAGFDDAMKNMLDSQKTLEVLNIFYSLKEIFPYKLIVDIDKVKRIKNMNVILGIISNSKKMKNINKLDKEHLVDFDFFYSVDELPRAKPDKEILDIILNNYKLSTIDCLIVGDSEVDYNFAKNAGIQFIPVNSKIKTWNKANHQVFNDVNDFLESFINKRNVIDAECL